MKKDITLKLKVTPKMLKDMEMNFRFSDHQVVIPKTKELISDIKRHFKSDKWDLSYDFYKTILIDSVVPGLGDYLVFSLLKAGYVLRTVEGKQGLMIRPSQKVKKDLPKKVKPKRKTK